MDGDCPRGLLLLNVFFLVPFPKCESWPQKDTAPLLFGDVDPHTFPPMVLFIDFYNLARLQYMSGCYKSHI